MKFSLISSHQNTKRKVWILLNCNEALVWIMLMGINVECTGTDFPYTPYLMNWKKYINLDTFMAVGLLMYKKYITLSMSFSRVWL
jgi:hypothetical protein